MLFTGLGRSVLGVSSTALGLRPLAVLETEGTVFPNTDRPRPVNNIYVFFGILDTDNISILVNYILLESKYFIYRCKLNKGSLCTRLLVDKFKKTFQTERFIAKKKNPFPR